MRKLGWLVVAAAVAVPGARSRAQEVASGAGSPVRLSLSDAVARAASQAPAVQLAGLGVEQATGQLHEARSALLPSLSAEAGWVNKTMNKNSFGIAFPTVPGEPPIPDLIGPFDTYDARMRVKQTLFDVSSLLRMKSASAVVTGSEAIQDVAVQDAAQRAAVAYLKAARAQALLAAREADAELSQELLQLAEDQLSAGVGTAIDVTRAKTQLLAAQGQVVVTRNQVDQAQMGLARALGVAPSTRFALSDSLTTTVGESNAPTAAADALALAMSRRPDLQVEQARRTAAERAKRAIAMERLPRLDLEADYGTNGPRLNNTIGTGQVAVELTVPFLDGFKREARVAEQDAAIREADVRERDLRQQIETDVNAALLDLQSGLEQEKIAAQRLALAEEELSQARERFRSGVAGNIEVIDAQATLNKARDAEIDARYTTAVARVSLARATGTAGTIHA